MFHHFVNLLGRSWIAFVDSLGDTSLGFISPYVVPIVGLVVYGWVIHQRDGWEAVKQHLKETLTRAVIVAIAAEVLVFGSIFGWTVVKTVYADHQSLVASIERLRKEAVPTIAPPKALPSDTPDDPQVSATITRISQFRIQRGEKDPSGSGIYFWDIGGYVDITFLNSGKTRADKLKIAFERNAHATFAVETFPKSLLAGQPAKVTAFFGIDSMGGLLNHLNCDECYIPFGIAVTYQTIDGRSKTYKLDLEFRNLDIPRQERLDAIREITNAR